MSNIVSQNNWIQIVIQFEPDKLAFLQESNCFLYILQGLISTNPTNCHLYFGASIYLGDLTSSPLTILVDQWPFWVSAYADRGSIPSDFPSNELDQSAKQSLAQNFFEVDSTGSHSPKIVLPTSTVLTRNQDWDEYTLGLFNKSNDSFYIGLGRAFQWSQGQNNINNPDWTSMIGCNCFLLLDSQLTAYWRFSNKVIMLISSEEKKNGTIISKKLSGYPPCYFELKARKSICLFYDETWKNKSGGSEFKILNQEKIDGEELSNLLIQSSSEQFVTQKIKLEYGKRFSMCTSSKKEYIVSASYESLVLGPPKYYYPRVTVSDTRIELLLSGGNGSLKDGDTVKIETTEQSVGNSKILGAFTTPSLYYETDDYGEKQQWTIHKKNNHDPAIYYGDEVYFVNRYWTDQWLCIKDSGPYLTTKKGANAYWFIDDG